MNLFFGAILCIVIVVLFWLIFFKKHPVHFSDDFLKDFYEELDKKFSRTRTELNTYLTTVKDSIVAKMDGENKESTEFFRQMSKDFHSESNKMREVIDNKFRDLQAGNEKKLEEMRKTVDEKLKEMKENNEKTHKIVEIKLKEMQEGNEQKLEKMRETVDEKLQKTLNTRLDQSFDSFGKKITELREKFGDVEALSKDFKDVEKIFRNVKTRGIFGERQLENLLEEAFVITQYRKNVRIKDGSKESVEFVIVCPTNDDLGEKGESLLPIDSKFPIDVYNRFVEARDKCDEKEMIDTEKNLISSIKQSAKKIKEKYISPPKTTDYAFLFLPTESLYMEVCRLGLVEEIWQKFRIMVTGPMNFYAIIHSFRLNFRLIHFSQSHAQAFKLLEGLKKEFDNFAKLLEKSRNKIREAGESIDTVQKKSGKISNDLAQFSVSNKSKENIALNSDEIAQKKSLKITENKNTSKAETLSFFKNLD